MRKSFFIFVLMIVAILPGWTLGALNEVASRSQFSSEAMRIDFENLTTGTAASDQLAKWGVEFLDGSHGMPTVSQAYEWGVLTTVIENTPSVGDSSSKQMIINFPNPAAKVGFNAFNLGSSGGTVTLTAYNAQYELLGTLSLGGVENADFVGVEPGITQGISSLHISYGANADPEQIADISIELVQRPQFVSYLAQYADGPISATVALQTTLLITNLSDSTATGSIEFFKSDGSAENVEVNGTVSDNFDLDIPPYSARTYSTPASFSTLVFGYARVSSSVPIAATGIFRTVNSSGQIISEAGLSLEEGAYTYVGGVKQEIAKGLKSGIAVVNISSGPISASIELYDEDGDLISTNVELLQLEAGEHRAVYLPEMFAQLSGQDFSGTLRIVSSGKVAGVILRSANSGAGDVVISSLPLGTLE
jgi:hypothetical protein